MGAWNAVVQAEAAVVYAYAVAGPQLPDAERSVARTLYDSHEQARDDALLAATAAGGTAVDIPTFFALPNEVDTPELARGLLATVESRLVGAYADLVAALPPQERQIGLDQILLTTARAMQWGAQSGAWGAQADQGS